MICGETRSLIVACHICSTHIALLSSLPMFVKALAYVIIVYSAFDDPIASMYRHKHLS